MTSVAEAATAATSLGSTLQAGLETVSLNQIVTFTKYIRLVLPIDGFAYWVRADLVNPNSVYNSGPVNTSTTNASPSAAPAPTIQVKGSLHYTTENQQDETEGFATNRVTFTSEFEIETMTDINPSVMYIGEFDGLQFSFSQRSMYRQANLFHYQGFAVYPAMATQILNSLDAVNFNDLIVSNSLPVWLTLNQFAPVYPSFLSPDNITPPWCTVHIEPGQTLAIQSSPYIDASGTHWQLTTDTVSLTFYGLNNGQIQDFVDYINEYTINTDVIGIMNMPVVRDEKRTQAELNILAQRKTLVYEVSYYQERMRELARQYITSALINVLPN